MEEPGSSVSQQSLVPVSERSEEAESSAVCQSLPSDTTEAQRSGLASDSILQLKVFGGHCGKI